MWMALHFIFPTTLKFSVNLPQKSSINEKFSHSLPLGGVLKLAKTCKAIHRRVSNRGQKAVECIQYEGYPTITKIAMPWVQFVQYTFLSLNVIIELTNSVPLVLSTFSVFSLFHCFRVNLREQLSAAKICSLLGKSATETVLLLSQTGRKV